MFSQVDIEDRLRRAQLAILSPDTNPSVFLLDDQVHSTMSSAGAAFSQNYISVEISGPEITNLSFCDLPGGLKALPVSTILLTTGIRTYRSDC